MKDIVVSLEWAKKLEEAGWPQYHGEVFGWFEDMNGKMTVHEVDNFSEDDHVAAPTAEEILRELPDSFARDQLRYDLTIRTAGGTSGKMFYVSYKHWHDQLKTVHRQGEDHSLANAAAELWIYLKENNLL